LKLAGNRLDKATVLYAHLKPDKSNKGKMYVFLWMLHVEIFVTKENRSKTNEMIISRDDTATVVMYRKRATLAESEVVLVKEFRCAVSNHEGYVYDLPSGGLDKNTPAQAAMEEVEEETGLSIKDPKRFHPQPIRQYFATLATHKSHLFSVELTEDELNHMKKEHGKPHGLLEESERTYVEVIKVSELLNGSVADWSTVGMIMSVFGNLF